MNAEVEIFAVGCSDAEWAELESHHQVAKSENQEASEDNAQIRLSRIQSLKDFDPGADPNRAPTLLRLFGRAQSDALVWLGPQARVPTEVAILGVADGILFLGPNHAPMVFGCFADVFCETLVADRVLLDRSGSGLIVISSDEVRAMAVSVATAFSRLGLKRILIVDTDDSRSAKLVNQLRRRLLAIEFEAISRGHLTQLPSEASIAVSFVESGHRDILEDLSYMNFLKQGGVWLDWFDAARDVGLADEIRDAGASVLQAAPFKKSISNKTLLRLRHELQVYRLGSR